MRGVGVGKAAPKEVREGLTTETESPELELEGHGQVSEICKGQEGLSEQRTASHDKGRRCHRAKPGDFGR